MALGRHCLKTWSATQGAVALSSAEAEFYAMVDGVLRAKWAVTVARKLGCGIDGGELVLGTDSSAAKSFVSRRGLGKMRHLEVRDLWLQEEVLKGCVKVEKIPGESNPADLMTKFLGWREIQGRLEGMGIEVRPGWKMGEPRVGEIGGDKPKRGRGGGRLVAGDWAEEDAADEGAWEETARWITQNIGQPSGTATIGRVGITSPSPA